MPRVEYIEVGEENGATEGKRAREAALVARAAQAQARTADTVAGEPSERASIAEERVAAPLAEVSPLIRSLTTPGRARKKGDAVIIGSAGEIRTRIMKTRRGTMEVKTHIAQGVDPKILKAARRAQMRAAQGRWDGKPK